MLLPSFVGAGSMSEACKLYSLAQMADGQVARVTKYLGSQISAAGNNGPELASRMRASRGAFFEMGKFWYRHAAPCSFNKLVMQAKVQSTLVSGMESFIVSDAEALQLDELLL